MFWFKKKENTTLNKLLPILEIVEVEITKLKHEIDMINAKLKSKFFKKKENEDLEDKTNENNNTENSLKDDGFEELRNLRKSGVL